MSGKRTKALRREFRRLHGRAPATIENKRRGWIYPGTINEFRRFKRAALRS